MMALGLPFLVMTTSSFSAVFRKWDRRFLTSLTLAIFILPPEQIMYPQLYLHHYPSQSALSPTQTSSFSRPDPPFFSNSDQINVLLTPLCGNLRGVHARSLGPRTLQDHRDTARCMSAITVSFEISKDSRDHSREVYE